jgi:multiple sugar transport system substrate-binding protein
MMKCLPRYAVIATTAALAVSLTACGDGGDDGVVELTFRQFDEASQIEGLVAAVDAWNGSHPAIQVTLETVTGNSAKEQYAREASTGAGPDVEQLAAAWVPDLAKPQILLPLDGLIESRAPGQGLDSFLATDLVQLDGSTWALPWTADTFALTYRQDVLAQYGQAVPATWTELLDSAAAISRQSGGGTDGFCFSAGSSPDAAQWFMINYYLWSNGQSLVEQNAAGEWALGVDEAQVRGAMEYFADFFTTGATDAAMVGVTSFADPAIVEGLRSGSCAMSSLPPAAFRAAAAGAGGPLMTAPMPGGTETRISHLGGRALGINPNSEHPEEAWEFIQYLISADTFATYEQYPAQKAVLEELDVPESETGFADALPNAVSFARYTASGIPVSSMQKVVNQQFGAVYSGQSSPADAAKGLIDQFNDLLSD